MLLDVKVQQKSFKTLKAKLTNYNLHKKKARIKLKKFILYRNLYNKFLKILTLMEPKICNNTTVL